ncbi:RICIN domain-containing protein [Actinomadura parmotrematis]|uniref:Ricin-type beta-trefoil lectin domain protein n=1 Tax=Actinomadura parmotrematis TaxID=2864039 RepID=A0ABS7FWH0_9ACTN|nr:RICIN domain-containing protein [Actinomadura parmotrematis]MBW8484768.1 ricin-type beta-trefoil lectin domain protein [Actinomadura parmotrematis]
MEWRRALLALLVGVLAVAVGLGGRPAFADGGDGDPGQKVRLSGANPFAAQGGERALGFLVNSASGKCLDHSDNGKGLYAYVFACNLYANNQLWKWECVNSACDVYRVRNLTSNKCLDQSDWGRGLYAYVYDCNGATNQNWYLYSYPAIGSISIVNQASDKCLDHSDAGKGLYAYVFACNHSAQQLWKEEPLMS